MIKTKFDSILANQGTRPAPIMKMLTTHSLLCPRMFSGMCCRAVEDHTTTLPWENAPMQAENWEYFVSDRI